MEKVILMQGEPIEDFRKLSPAEPNMALCICLEIIWILGQKSFLGASHTDLKEKGWTKIRFVY